MKLNKFKEHQLKNGNKVFGGSTINRISESNQVNAPFIFGSTVHTEEGINVPSYSLSLADIV